MKDVVDKVVLLAGKGQIPWKTTADQSAFAATFGSLSVLLSQRVYFERSIRFSSYKLAVLDEKGSEIDSAAYNTTGLDTRFRQLESIFNSAKRSALGIDRRLEELIEAMDAITDE